MPQISDSEQRDLLKRVLSNEVHWREGLETVTFLTKAWHTKAWKEKRKAKLASQCENCGSSTLPLVLQHTWHPNPITQLFCQTRRKYLAEWALWKQAHPIDIDTSSLIPDADGCPKCGSPTVRYRKRAKTWICVSKPVGVTCGHVFETPIRVVSHGAIGALAKLARQRIQDQFDDEFGIGKEVTVAAIEQHLRYTSLEDTKTLCKRCAFVEDKTNMVLCAICNKNYHSKGYDRCSTCAGIDTTESRKFYHAMKRIDRYCETGDESLLNED